MPSSRRSSRSTKSPNPPTWRSVSLSKNSASASLSYVFAEPEQGSPLASATSKLPASKISRNKDSSDVSDSITPLPNGMASTSGGQSGLNGGGDDLGTTLAGEFRADLQGDSIVESIPVHAPNLGEATSHKSAPSILISTGNPIVDSNSVIFPSAEQEIEPKPLQGKTSWFGSLSRSKGRNNIATTNAAVASSSEQPFILNPDKSILEVGAVTSTNSSRVQLSPPSPELTTDSATSSISSFISPLIPQKPPLETIQPHSDVSLPTSSPQTIPPSTTQAKRSWFSSPPVSRPDISTTQHSTSNSISSVDEVVPSLSTLTPPSSVSSPSIVASPGSQSDNGTGRPRLSSLNPSNSRFTLSIPLLGRPKIPLDKAVAVARAEAHTKVETMTAAETEQRTEITTIATTTTTATVSAQDPVSIMGDSQASGPTNRPSGDIDSTSLYPEPSVHESSSSWWNYIGWTTSSAPSISGPDAREHVNPIPLDSDAIAAATSNTTDSSSSQLPISNPTSATAQPAKPILEPKDLTQPLGTGNEMNVLSKVPSVQPADEPRTRQRDGSESAWYTPWAWYTSASNSTAALPAGGTDDSDSEAIEGPVSGRDVIANTGAQGREERTQSEMIKDAALARPGSGGETYDSSGSGTGETCAKLPQANSDTGYSVNPIESSIETNRTGWASFFSSKSLMTQMITAGTAEKRDENGMEVMDIDEEDTGAEKAPVEQNAVSTVTGDPTTVDSTRSKKAVQPTSRSLPQKSSGPPSNEIRLTAPPLTISETLKRETVKSNLVNQKSKPVTSTKKPTSLTPSTKNGYSTPGPHSPPPPNLLLPTWADTFHTAPRSVIPPPPTSKFAKTMQFVSGVLFATDKHGAGKDSVRRKERNKGKGKEQEYVRFGQELPRAWDVMGDKLDPDILRGCRRVVVIGIHGWFPGAIMRTVLGEPTGTSGKFVNMMVQALEEFQQDHSVKLEKITKVPLEGEGTIDGRVEKLYSNLKANREWMDDLHAADAILVATHSQGSVVSTHLLDALIRDKHIRTSRNTVVPGAAESFPTADLNRAPALPPQRVCCLALCGIHLGPLRYLSSSSLLQPYIQYFESVAARELFEFQDTESQVSKNYVMALRRVVNNGTKMLYVASLNDQVVPLYSGLFTAVSHPLILRALYIDGDAYHSSDFLSNLLVLLLRVLNSGISDSGLLAHLSEATAGSLNGVGHSTAYEEISTYSLAVKYLFLTNDGLDDHTDLVLEPFNATTEQNDYEIPWSLRDVIADDRVAHFFSQEIVELRDAFRDWHPKTTILRDLKRKLQPIQRLPSKFSSSSSKL